MNLFGQSEISQVSRIPHVIKYMGSKRNIIDFVVEAIDELYLDKDQYLYDLFAGSSIVGGSFRNLMNVSCNDIQSYSKVLGGLYLNNYYWDSLKEAIIDDFFQEVEERVEKFLKANSEIDLIDYDRFDSFESILKDENIHRELANYKFNSKFDHLFAKEFSATYWSYEQCVWIDAIASIVRKKKYNIDFFYNMINGALMFSMAYCSQSTGHYAQYRDLKPENFSDILIYRRKKLFPIFQKKVLSLRDYFNGENNHNFNHEFTSLDFADALKNVNERSIVYDASGCLDSKTKFVN